MSDDRTQEERTNDRTERSHAKSSVDVGAKVAFAISFLCLIGAIVFLSYYLFRSNTGLKGIVTALGNSQLTEGLLQKGLYAQMDASRVTLVSCAMVIGMAVCFLGFALFLLGVRGDIDAAGKAGDNYSLTLSRLSPGALIIIAGVTLVGICVVNRPEFVYVEGAGGNTQELLKRLEEIKNRSSGQPVGANTTTSTANRSFTGGKPGDPTPTPPPSGQ